MHIGIIKEEKTPSDSRVTLTPSQCKLLIDRGWKIEVQSSQVRSYSDEEYQKLSIPVVDNIEHCDILIGVKEVPIEKLIPNKTYFFFSHTIKEQAYNRNLLKALVAKNIRLIDYEVLTNEKGARVIAFGKFAGMVGAHNAVWAFGKKTKKYKLPRLKDLTDYKAAKDIYQDTDITGTKIVLTGTGRVANGAAMVLDDMGIKKVSALDFLANKYTEPVYTQLSSFYYTERKDGVVHDDVRDFYQNPKAYQSQFHHFLKKANIMINGIYWDNDAPAFFNLEDIDSDDFNLKVIADVTCDIAPVSSIPTTFEASTIPNPVFGVNRSTKEKTEPFQEASLDMMTIDNLPNELPRDASQAFGEMFIEHVIPELNSSQSQLLNRATVCKNGNLGEHFEYLRDYLNGSD